MEQQGVAALAAVLGGIMFLFAVIFFMVGGMEVDGHAAAAGAPVADDVIDAKSHALANAKKILEMEKINAENLFSARMRTLLAASTLRKTVSLGLEAAANVLEASDDGDDIPADFAAFILAYSGRPAEEGVWPPKKFNMVLRGWYDNVFKILLAPGYMAAAKTAEEKRLAAASMAQTARRAAELAAKGMDAGEAAAKAVEEGAGGALSFEGISGDVLEAAAAEKAFHEGQVPNINRIKLGAGSKPRPKSLAAKRGAAINRASAASAAAVDAVDEDDAPKASGSKRGRKRMKLKKDDVKQFLYLAGVKNMQGTMETLLSRARDSLVTRASHDGAPRNFTIEEAEEAIFQQKLQFAAYDDDKDAEIVAGRKKAAASGGGAGSAAAASSRGGSGGGGGEGSAAAGDADDEDLADAEARATAEASHRLSSLINNLDPRRAPRGAAAAADSEEEGADDDDDEEEEREDEDEDLEPQVLEDIIAGADEGDDDDDDEGASAAAGGGAAADEADEPVSSSLSNVAAPGILWANYTDFLLKKGDKARNSAASTLSALKSTVEVIIEECSEGGYETQRRRWGDVLFAVIDASDGIDPRQTKLPVPPYWAHGHRGRGEGNGPNASLFETVIKAIAYARKATSYTTDLPLLSR